MSREIITGIYKITNLVNGKMYIGQSIDIYKRWKEHNNIAFRTTSKSYNYPLYKAIRKYGIDNFKFEIIEECSIEKLNDKEIYYIDKYNTCIFNKNSFGYNMTLGGEGHRGYKHSEETKQKISKNHADMSGENCYCYGKHRSEEIKQKISNSRKGKYGGINHPLYGKHHTQETKDKISEANKGKEGYIRHKVICENMIFKSIKECSEYYNVNRQTMGMWLNHTRPIPKEFYDKELHFEGESMENYKIRENIDSYKNMRKEIICENKKFKDVKEFMDFYNIKKNKNTVVTWLCGNKPMPKEWWDKGLRYEDKNMNDYVVQTGKKDKHNSSSKRVFCDGLVYETIKSCAEHYNKKPKTMSSWLNGTRKMPKLFQDLGLSFYE